MSNKTARSVAPTDSRLDLRTLQATIEALNLELAQKDLLLTQGFEAFTHAAEKLQDSHKRLQREVAALNLELDQKNKELERNLIEKEKVKTYLSNIFESLDIGVFVTDLDGGITSVNRAGLAMLGTGAEALVGLNVERVMGAQLLPPPARPPDIESRLEVGEPIPFTRSDGEALQLQVSVNLMTDETQSPLGYILNVQDVTLLKKLEEHAERRNRFTAMGEMAANIAHEIRNPLGSIELFASLVKKGLAEQDDKMELVNHISSGIASMNHIISNLLEYTKPRPVSLIRLNLHDLLGEVVEFTRFMADQNQVEIHLKLAAERPWVLGDGEHLKQVFHNLFLNAVQAMPEGGRLVLSTRKCSLTKAKLISRFGEGSSLSEPLDVIEVACRDSGPGIPPEIQRRIFDPFFSTKARGTGLGLAIVHNIIESHRGAIDVESRNGEGTTFILMFPLIPDEGAEQRADGSKAGTGKSPGRRLNP